MNPKHLDNFIKEAITIEAEEARAAGAFGYMARALVQATMPHKKTDKNEFIRKNGTFTLSILTPSQIGLPYGSLPRLLIAWLIFAIVSIISILCDPLLVENYQGVIYVF